MPTPSALNVELEALKRLTKDVKEAALKLPPQEIRYLVDAFYQLQENRKVASNQTRALTEADEPHLVIDWLTHNNMALEANIKTVLDAVTSADPVGRWAKSIVGIGPVLSAGLAAHIDIAKAPTVGHIWSFAGLNPEAVWSKGSKRPWNARLKTLCWKIGESFVYVSNHEDDIYGKIYKERKELEIERNTAGAFAAQAAARLAKFKIGHDTIAFKHYQTGQLPPAHVHARARRYAVKLFLAHWHHVAYEVHFKTPPPKPYILTQPNHVHYLAPPNWPPA